jgi:hypothetical protein
VKPARGTKVDRIVSAGAGLDRCDRLARDRAMPSRLREDLGHTGRAVARAEEIQRDSDLFRVNAEARGRAENAERFFA